MQRPMTTPLRLPDFDMSSGRKPTPGMGMGQLLQVPTSYHADAAAPGMPPMSNTPAATSGRDAEQRFARLLAEAEYKLLEEKSRSHEREAKLKEELARERAQIPKIVNERLEQALKDRAAGSGLALSASDDVNQIRQQLTETQRLLADTERRYQQEKRELLNLRTNQLKNETTKRGQEGDIIARAMQVMAEYETIVRSSEENSLARLAHHMEAFEREWVQRSKEFEERKADFETTVMTKAIDALKEHNQDVEGIGQKILSKTVDLIKQQSASRLELERQVLEQSESFKQQYKELCDAEYRERCRAYDEQLANRERNLVSIIAEERDRIIAHERSAVAQAEMSHVQCLGDAMKEVSMLREQLVREQHEQQTTALTELLRKRDEMKAEQLRMIDEANQRMTQIERQCIEAVETAQKAMCEMQVEMSRKESELAKQALTKSQEWDRHRAEEINTARAEIEKQWKAVVEEIRAQHGDELRRVRDETQDRFDKEHADQFKREQEVRRSYEAKISKMEESLDARWAKRLSESNQSLERHLEVIQALRDDNELLNHQLSSLQQQLSLRESDFETKLATVRREHEQVWHKKMEEMRQRYDQLLDEALGGSHGDSVSRTEHDKVLETLRELEERLVELKRTENDRLGRERQQLNDMWRSRLEQERSERAVWEEEQLKKLTEMRVELDADCRRKETELLRRAEQERIRLHDEAMRRTLEDRRDREAFEERHREEWHMRVREAEDELNVAYAEKVKVLERRYEEKERELDKQRQGMHSEMTKFEQSSRAQAHAWLEMEKETILADVKKFHEKLSAEQERMEENRVLFEQKISLKYADMYEQAKRDLHARMLDVTRYHVAYWQRCEAEWLSFRSDEVSLLLDFRNEHQARVMQFAQRATERANAEAAALLALEREQLDKKQAQLYADVESARLAHEVAARDRALKLLDERDRIQEEADKQRAIEEAKVWDSLQNKILEKEHSAEADRRILELELRSRYESMVTAERARVDQLMEQHRKDARTLYERHEATIREREEQWHRQRLAIEAEEQSAHEQQYHELRAQCENRVAEERKRFESTMRLREMEFDKERQRLLDGLDSQFKNHEKETRQSLQSMKEDYESRLKTMMVENQAQREHHLIDVSEQERKFQQLRDEYEAETIKRFDRAMTELRTQIEQRTREHQQREIEMRENLEKQRRTYEERINQQYEGLLKDHEDRLFGIQKERDERVISMEREHQQALLHLRGDMERNLSEKFQNSDAQFAAATENLRKQFQSRLEEFGTLMHDERQKRQTAENRLSTLRDEMEMLRSSVEQAKLDVFRSAQAKYDRLLADFKDKARKEREDMARRHVEEEERRLAKELVKTDQDSRRDTKEEINRNWDARERANAATPANVTATPAPMAPPQSADDRAAVEQMPKRKEKLNQLWHVLDMPTSERTAFLDRVHALPPYRCLDEINGEIKRLEVQLPLLEVVTRRDFVQHRLVELSRAGRSASGGASQQLEELQNELRKLTEQLKSDIPKHEAKYGSQFLFRGRPFLETLLAEEGGRAAYGKPPGSTPTPRSSMVGTAPGGYRTPSFP